eukprot:Ihof_evm2s89 gene=Ihof_evmTU2s89
MTEEAENSGLWRRIFFALEVLQVNSIDGKWVDSQYSNNFCEFPVPPFEECDPAGAPTAKALDALRRACNTLMTDSTHSKTLWVKIGKKGVQSRSLVSLLFYFMEAGLPMGFKINDENSDDEDTNITPKGSMQIALLAATVYLQLLRIPGSGAYNIYQSILFKKTLDLLAHCSNFQKATHAALTRLCNGKYVRVGKKGSKGKRWAGRKGNKNTTEDIEGQGSSDVIEDLSADVEELIENILALTKTISLGEDGMAHVVDVMTAIVVAGTENDTRLATGLQSLALDCLQAVVSDKHAAMEYSCTVLFNALEAAFNMTAFKTQPNPATKPQLALSISMTEFVRRVVQAKPCPAVYSSLRVLIQQLCVNVSDRTEYRNNTCEVVAHLMDLLPEEDHVALLDWVARYGRHTRVSYRVAALGIVKFVLTNHFTESGDNVIGHDVAILLLQTLTARASDKIPSVRAKALSCMAAVMQLDGLKVEIKREILGCSGEGERNDEIMAIVRQRIKDEKTYVRKAALQVLEEASQYGEYGLQEGDALCVHERCLDPISLVRKQALACLQTMAGLYPTSTTLQGLWLDGILPMILDPDTSIQEKVAEVMESAILIPLASGEAVESVWHLLSRLPNNGGIDLTVYFTKCCKNWANNNKLTPKIVERLMAKIDEDVLNTAPWVLLAEVAACCPSLVTYDAVGLAWERCLAVTEGTPHALVYVVRVLASIAEGKVKDRSLISKVTAATLADKLLSQVLYFKAPPALMAQMINTITQLVNNHNLEKHGGFDQWDIKVMTECESYLAEAIFTNPGQLAQDPENIAIHLFTLGELVQSCPNGLTEKMEVIVQSLISPVLSSQPNIRPIAIPATIRAHAFIALGKVCLQRESLAKKCIAALVKELETGSNPVIRNNVIVVMCDLCVRYSTLVDSYIPNIATCLRDESAVVRQQTLALLTPLLQEDYVKWKGSLFFRFISTLVDEDNDIRRFAEFCLVNMLALKHPNIFFNNFVEAVFHFNGYMQHKIYNRFPQSPRELRLFCLQGPANASKRHAIYEALLNYMSDEQRLQLTAKLIQDVLAAAVDREIPLDKQSEALLGDTLVILASKSIKLTSMRVKKNGLDEEDMEMTQSQDTPGPSQALARAKSKMLSSIVKKNVIENIVPTVIALKGLLEEEHSPLLRLLMEYLRETMEDYKDEVMEVLEHDRQLADEIEFDLRRYEELIARNATYGTEGNGFAAPLPTSAGKAPPRTPNAMAHTPLKELSAPRIRPSATSSAKKTAEPCRTPGSKAKSQSNTQNDVITGTPVRHGNDQSRQSPRIQQSPMPTSLPLRLYSDNQDNESPMSRRPHVPLPDNVLVMESPNKKPQKPRQWNISSP